MATILVADDDRTTCCNSDGTGLGLAIVPWEAETRSGSIDFETGPDGSTFRLVF